MISAIIQARMGSSRLGGKVMMKVLDKPLLQHMIERLKYSQYIEEIIIATTTNERDGEIVNLCEKLNINFFCGSENDVLDRYYNTAKKNNVDIIVRMTSDCPLIDPEISDKVISYYIKNQDRFDYVSNMHPPTYPDGLDTEIFPFDVLEKTWDNAKQPHEREHVSPYIWDNPSTFRIGNVTHEKELHLQERWTLDYEKDYLFLKRVFEELYPTKKIFYMNDVLDLLNRKPEIRKINQDYAGMNWWANEWEKLKTTDTLRSGKKQLR